MLGFGRKGFALSWEKVSEGPSVFQTFLRLILVAKVCKALGMVVLVVVVVVVGWDVGLLLVVVVVTVVLWLFVVVVVVVNF